MLSGAVRGRFKALRWGGGSLLEINLKAGLLLYDVTVGLGLTQQERVMALGEDLDAEVENYIG